MKESTTRCTISPLRCDADWHRVRPQVEQLEASGITNPWMSWEAMFSLWKNFHREKTCWFIELPNGTELPAVALWLEATQRRHRLSWKILRSLDAMSIGIPPMFVPKGAEAASSRALAQAMPEIARSTDCDLVTLYRMENDPGLSLFHQLIAVDINARCTEYTQNQVIMLTDDLSVYMDSKMTSKTRRNTQRARRKIVKDFGEPVVFERMQGSPENSEEATRLWGEFLRLRSRSWQIAETGTEQIVDPIALDRWFSDIVGVWVHRGFIDLHLVRLGDIYVSALLVLSHGTDSWFTYTYYDTEYASYSPGLLGFIHAIETVHREGARRLDLGGEGASWKNRWATDQAPLLTIESPLEGWKATAWWLWSALRSRSTPK